MVLSNHSMPKAFGCKQEAGKAYALAFYEEEG
jgi:hypothetical protein